MAEEAKKDAASIVNAPATLKTRFVCKYKSNSGYKNRMVETGMETENMIEIKSGLKAGDIIVLTGAYLINSEFIFQNDANRWTE